MFDLDRTRTEARSSFADDPPDADRRHHELRDALSLARLQLDVVRRRVARDRHDPEDLDGGLERIRTSINRALGILLEETPLPRNAAGERWTRRFDD